MNASKSLMTLVAESSELENQLIQSGGEITPEIEALLEVKDLQLPDKVDNYGLVMDRMAMISEFYTQRAEMFLKMSKAADSVIDRCKSNLKLAMENLKTDEILGHDIKFKIVKSNPTVVIEDESKIDPAYTTTQTVVKIDKKRIGEDLKVGIEVAGAKLQQGSSLRQYANTPKSKRGSNE